MAPPPVTPPKSRPPRFLLLLLSLSLSCLHGEHKPATTRAPEADPWAGQYQCTGRNPAGQPYDLALVIVPLGSTYQLAWGVIDHQAQAIGVGIPQGEDLSVGFVAGDNLVGTGVYQRRDGELRGEYAIWQMPERYTETCQIRFRTEPPSRRTE